MNIDLKCPNPYGNPNCKIKGSPTGGLCKSCSPYKPRLIKICETCQQEYRTLNENKHFCSAKCFHERDLSYLFEWYKDKEKVRRAKDKLRETISNWSPEYLAEVTEKRRKPKGPYPESFRQYCYERTRKQLESGELWYAKHAKHGKYITNIGSVEYYDSIWELARMMQLDLQNIEWTKRHEIAIPYIGLDNRNHRYWPDFLIESKIIEEIKPRSLQNHPLNILKFEAARIYCDRFGLEFRILPEEIFKDFIEPALIYHDTNKKR